MATRKTKKAEETEAAQGTALEVTQAGGSLPADISGELEDLEDLGFSDRVEDRLIPILSILQEQSGEVKSRHTKHVDGAEPGMIIVRALQRIYASEITKDGAQDGVIFQPCAFDHMWVEWEGEPGEGAPIANYPFTEDPSVHGARQVQDPQDPDRMIWVGTSRNTRFVDTRYHYGHVIDGASVYAAVVAMGGTNHTISRQWTAIMDQKRVPTPQGPRKAPAWFCLYRLNTRFTERGSQSWFKYEIRELGWCQDADLRQMGRDLNEAIRAKEMVVDLESEAAPSSDTPPHDPETGEVIDEDAIPV